MNTEKELRDEILEKTKQLYLLREEEKSFVPGKTRVHYAGRVFDEKEMQAVVNSALDFWLTLGKNGDRFVSDFTSLMGMKYGLVLNSGSSANLVAVSALCSPNILRPLLPGDEVITTALAFPTTLNPILQNGLAPVFVDVEEGTYNIDASKLEQALSDKTRAIIFAHTLGNPAEMDVIMNFARAHDLYVIEDTCDALDSLYDGKRCGTYGNLSTYSFYAAHHITMGEGGALLTNDLNLFRQALSIRDWGRACYCRTGEENPNGACGHRFDHRFEGLPDGYDHKYVYSNIGYNLKPLDSQCAMGIEQLKKLPDFTAKRKKNFKTLYNALKEYEKFFILPKSLPKADPSWFSLPITVRDGSPFSRKEIVCYLEDHQVETRMLFTGNILKHPAYKGIAYRIAGELKNTEKVLDDTFFIGVYPGLTEEMLQYVADTFRAFLSPFSRNPGSQPESVEIDAEGKRPPLVSVVLLAYNHIDFTKKCVESLFQYTKEIDYELITVNNGSEDGTKEYFDSLPNSKKINFPENVGVDKAINAGFRLAEGKYTLNLSNDIVVTSHWLENLVTGMEADEKIAMAVPVCGFSSNNQQVSLQYKSLEEMQRLAEQYNRSNPNLWEERIRLVTYTCLFRTDVQKEIGGFDEDFNPGAYDDDAISFHIRRMGYKLMLASDTYVHHFGSVTFNAEYAKNNLAVRNQALFTQKFGVNSWAAGMIDWNVVNMGNYRRSDEVRILGIGRSCGATLLQIKNMFRKLGTRNAKLFYLSETDGNMADLQSICENCVCASPGDVKHHFGEQLYDLIVVESETDKLENIEQLYEDLCSMLKEDGRIITTAAAGLYTRIEKTLARQSFTMVKSTLDYYYAFDKHLS